MSVSDTGRRKRLPDNLENACAPLSAQEMEATERSDRIRMLKAEIKAGTYRADIKDIAMQLAAAMDPLM